MRPEPPTPRASLDPPEVRLAGAGVSFGGRWLFRGVDLVVPPGGWVTILGPSGSGKTTLLRLLCGLLPPTEGEARVDGRPWPSLPTAERVAARRRFGYVQQQPGLLHATVLQNLATPLRWRGLSPAEARRRAEAGLRGVGMDAAASQEALGLSGGERQRVAFARAVVPGPDVLLLDEFTTHQDPGHADVLESGVADHLERGGAVVLVAHDLGQVVRIRDASGRAPEVGVLLGSRWQTVPWDALRTPQGGDDPVASFLRRLALPAHRSES